MKSIKLNNEIFKSVNLKLYDLNVKANKTEN
jgi:hypothetical protein